MLWILFGLISFRYVQTVVGVRRKMEKWLFKCTGVRTFTIETQLRKVQYIMLGQGIRIHHDNYFNNNSEGWREWNFIFPCPTLCHGISYNFKFFVPFIWFLQFFFLYMQILWDLFVKLASKKALIHCVIYHVCLLFWSRGTELLGCHTFMKLPIFSIVSLVWRWPAICITK